MDKFAPYILHALIIALLTACTTVPAEVQTDKSSATTSHPEIKTLDSGPEPHSCGAY